MKDFDDQSNVYFIATAVVRLERMSREEMRRRKLLSDLNMHELNFLHSNLTCMVS